MSSRGSFEPSQSFSEGIGAMSEAVLSWEYSLRNELEIIHTCLKLIDGSVLAGLQGAINTITASIEEEIQSLKDIASQLSRSKGSLSEQSLEEYSLRKLKYNKLILQVEKLYSSAPELQDVVNRFPRSKFVFQNESQQQQQQLRLNGNAPQTNHMRSPSSQQLQQLVQKSQPPQLMMSKQIQQQQQSQLLSLGISNVNNSNLASRLAIPVLPSSSVVSASFKPPLSQNSLVSIPSPMSVAHRAGVEDTIKAAAKSRETTSDQPTIEQIRRELLAIKTQVADVNKKLDTHDHQEYALELDQLRRDNCLIAHDYKILKNDNTELMHSIRMLQKLATEVKMQNEDMLRQLHSARMESEGDIDDHQQQQQQYQRKSNYQTKEEGYYYDRPSSSSAVPYPRTIYNNNNNISGAQFYEDRQPVERVITRTNSRTNISVNHNNNNSSSLNNPSRGSELQQQQQQHYESLSQQPYPQQRSSGSKRQFIEESRENDVNVDLLSSWARKRIVDA